MSDLGHRWGGSAARAPWSRANWAARPCAAGRRAHRRHGARQRRGSRARKSTRRLRVRAAMWFHARAAGVLSPTAVGFRLLYAVPLVWFAAPRHGCRWLTARTFRFDAHFSSALALTVSQAVVSDELPQIPNNRRHTLHALGAERQSRPSRPPISRGDSRRWRRLDRRARLGLAGCRLGDQAQSIPFDSGPEQAPVPPEASCQHRAGTRGRVVAIPSALHRRRQQRNRILGRLRGRLGATWGRLQQVPGNGRNQTIDARTGWAPRGGCPHWMG